MKKVKQFIAELLIAVMLLTSGIFTAYADPVPNSGTGTVILNNAEIGTTYTLYKVFSAEVPEGSSGQASYFATNSELIRLIIEDHDKEYVQGVCPFDYQGTDSSIRPLPVMHRDMSPEGIEIGRGWLLQHIGDWGGIADKVSQKCTAGNTLTFSNLPYGYYLLTSDYAGDSIASVFTLMSAEQTINNKNIRIPGTASKSVYEPSDLEHIGIGDTEITYEVSFVATNFYTYTDSSVSEKITKYTVTDTFAGLCCTPSAFSVTATYGDNQPLTNYTFDHKEKTGFSITIPWVDDVASASIYPSPTTVKLKYTLHVDNKALAEATDLTAKNSAQIRFFTNEKPEGRSVGPTDPTTNLYSTGLSIRKFKSGSDTVLLDGAKFILYKEDGVKAYYHADTDGVYWTTDRALATEKLADNSYETCEFGGLDAGTYYLQETVAPAGYQLPGSPFTVTIQYIGGTQAYKFLTKVNGTPCEPGTGKLYATVKVSNGTAPALPTTGGAGTKLLLLCGAILFFATGIVLVAKKRLYNEG